MLSASLRALCPDGIYLSLTTGDPRLWSGVYFVRTGMRRGSLIAFNASVFYCSFLVSVAFLLTNCITGPYASAILRLKIAFPDTYPDSPPLIKFLTDIFHPLVVPLTIYTFSNTSTDVSETVSDERLPPGGITLRDGFPNWIGRREETQDAGPVGSGYSKICTSATRSTTHSLLEPELPIPHQQELPPVVSVLVYIKSTFEDVAILDNLNLEAVANPGALHAWRSYRGLPKVSSRAPTPEQGAAAVMLEQKQPGEWNWEGVWEKRVRAAIHASISDHTLYGTSRSEGNIDMV